MKQFYTSQVDEVLTELNSSANGLTNEEAKARLEKNGKNALDEAKKRPMILKFFDQFKDLMIIVLLAAALISGVLTIVQNVRAGTNEYGELIDSGLILLIVIVNAIIGLVQEGKAEKSLDALKNLNKPFAKVIRNGSIEKVPSEEIVVGDIVVLEAGDMVPADMRLIQCASLQIEEAALTGESVPVNKGISALENEEAPLGDRTCMAFSSGTVSFGRGQGVVTATGMNTEVGKIAKMLSEDSGVTTPLQKQLAKTAKFLSVLVLGIAAVIFAASVILSFVNDGKVSFDVIMDAFMTAVAIAVAAIPEGLPAVVTIVLAIGVQRMSERRAIVRNLPAVETLGCCEIICSDKTGTITLNQMTVKELYTTSGGAISDAEAVENDDVKTLVRIMCLCNDTTSNEEGKLVGDPTETALVAYAQKKDLGNLGAYTRVDEIPFDSKRKLMSTVNDVDGKRIIHVKGAPDMLLDKCEYILVNGEARAITDSDKENILNANSTMADKALRVLAYAIKLDETDREKYEEGLTFVGLTGMIDPARDEVKEAVAVCKKAGIRAIMITGDHAKTAAAIAREVGIIDSPDQEVLTGAELDKMSEEEYMANIHKYRVYARVSPENKVRIVKAYRALDKVVAMTGDGVNDAPSIKSADIGIGMGITGTDVSKGASDMVLADDNFATIVNAVEEGRKVYANIKKAVQYLLSANIAEVLCLFIASIVISSIVGHNVVFLTPVMILWVNMVTDSLPALALGTEKAEADVMDHPPRKSGSSLFAGKTGIDIIIQGLMQTVLVMASFLVGFLYFEKVGAGHEVSETMAFVTLCFIQLFHSFNLKSQKQSIINKGMFNNKFLNLSFVVGLVLVVLVVAIPGLGENLFGTKPLTWDQWLIAIGASFLIVPMVELQKFIERKLEK
ncbi:MAG: calcium-translocating P-type ATPase, PMCA-type [Clostridia bacterium]|nr:calcium-translocating P-type ATPase, PMCA-type [Clostridia bacterium]